MFVCLNNTFVLHIFHFDSDFKVWKWYCEKLSKATKRGLNFVLQPDWKIADPVCTFVFSVIVLGTTLTIMRDILVVLMEGKTVCYTLQGFCFYFLKLYTYSWICFWLIQQDTFEDVDIL